MMCYLLAHALGAKIRVDDLQRIPEWTASALTLESSIARLSESYYRFMVRAVVVGRGLNWRQCCRVCIEDDGDLLCPGRQLFCGRLSLHGPIAMVERSFPVFMFAPPGVTWPGMRRRCWNAFSP